MLESGISMQYTVENVRDTLAKGLAGGGDGAPGYLMLRAGTDRERILRERVTYFGPFDAGDLISVRSGGGGGLGRPHERDPELVAADVRDGRLSPIDAERVYGVRLQSRDGAWSIDAEGTTALRADGARD
jgi:N-methylhydantoinase B